MEQVQIFISYAREDQEQAREIYRRLVERGYKPWLDEEDLLPGQNFRLVIEKSLSGSDFVIICLSKTSVVKRSFFQREIKHALDKLQEMRPEDIFVIPARLDDCQMPDELKDRHWVDLFNDRGWEKLFKALEIELRNRGKSFASTQSISEPLKPATPAAQPPIIIRTPREKSVTAASDGSIFQFITVKTDDRGKVIDRQTKQARQLIEDLGGGLTLEMVELAGGKFQMGSPANEDGRSTSEIRHEVQVSPFFIGKYPVTQAQWQAVMGSLPKGLSGDDHPISSISWDEANEFCGRLTRKTNHQYRLPTEAEWEYACRAGTTTPFAFGPTITPEIVNYNGNYPYGAAPKGEYRKTTIPVGSLGVANAFGLFEMHGNVWEWCSDWYGGSYYEECRKQNVVADPHGPSTGSLRVIRGGGWYLNAVYCRSAFRTFLTPGDRYDYLGFRLVRIGR